MQLHDYEKDLLDVGIKKVKQSHRLFNAFIIIYIAIYYKSDRVVLFGNMRKPISVFDNISTNKYLPMFILLVISVIFRFPFILEGFGENDSANLAVSIIDFITHGKQGLLTNLYFIDVVPLYVVYIKYSMKLLNNDYSLLVTVMNYTNAVVGTLIIIPAYFLVKRLFDNTPIAFYTALTFIFVPSIYQSSIYGFPHLVALFFFIASLYFFLRWLDGAGYVWLILSFVTLTGTVLFKSDLILGIGAYFGLLYIRKVKDKEKTILTSLVIIGAIGLFFVVRQWMIGINEGYTTSTSGFLEWFKHFIHPLLSKGVSQIVKNQVGAIAFGIGFLNFAMAIIAFTFYLVKKKSDIIVLVLSWTAVPTVLWLLLWINSARHNVLSVLPLIMIIFLFINEKAPRAMAFFPIILILGNLLMTSPSGSTRIPSGDLFKSREMLDARVNDLHLVAGEIAALKDDKIIFSGESFRPYIYYEIFSMASEYELTKINDTCHMLKNKNGGNYICMFAKPDPADDIREMIDEYDLEEYSVVVPVLPDSPASMEQYLTSLKEKRFKIYRYNRSGFLGKI